MKKKITYLLEQGIALVNINRANTIYNKFFFSIMVYNNKKGVIACQKLVTLLLLFTIGMTTNIRAQTCNSQEYIYLNEPAANSILKFEVSSALQLTEKIGVNGGPHWYPGTGVSEVLGPHGLGTDLNGNLYIGGGIINGPFLQRKFNCDGALSPVDSKTIEATAQNTFSIGNILYSNIKTVNGVVSDGQPSAYNTCTGQYLGSLCLNGAMYENGGAGDNLWGFSYNPTTQLVYVTRRYDRRTLTGNPDAVPKVWVLTKAQFEANIAGTGSCIDPLLVMGSSADLNVGDKALPNILGEVMGITSDNAGNFYVVCGFGWISYIYKYDASGGFVTRTVAPNQNSPYQIMIGIVWSEATNRLYTSHYTNNPIVNCVSAFDANTMAYLGTAAPNPGGPSDNTGKAIAILKESCPINLPATFTRNVCGTVGKKFYLNQEAFAGCDGIVCSSSWTPTSMTGMTFNDCDNSVTITGEGCGVFTLNIGAVTSTGCGQQTSTFTICNTFPPNITINTQPICTATGKYTLTGTVTVASGAPPTGTLTVRVPGGGSQVFNAPFASTINFSIPNITTFGGTRSVYADFSDTNCSKEQTYTEPLATCTPVCIMTVKPTVSGCYQNNGSKATVSLEVSWANTTVSPTTNDASDAITVTFAGVTKTIDPGPYTTAGGSGTIVSPQVVAFEVAADASTQTAQAFIGTDYASATCKVEQTGIILPAACPPTICANGQTGGTVWNDYNGDGIKQVGETTGLQDIMVKAYDCNGNIVGIAITDAFGKYAFTTLTPASYPIRVEFSNLPAFVGQGTLNGSDGHTTVQFVSTADCNVDLGILDPTDYCQLTPKLYIPSYISGDPITGSSSGNGAALVAFTYGATGLKDPAKTSVIATADKIGTLWGVAYSKQTKKLYGTATIKRHAGLGPQGIGGLYTIDVATNTVTGIDLSSLGINVGSIASNAARGLVSDPTQPSADTQAFTAIGKEGLGGVDISVDGSFLYVVSLKDKKLNKLNITGSTPTLVGSYNMPNPGCTGGEWRPFATKVYKGKVYVGGVCDAQTSDNKSNLRAYVYAFDESSSTFNSTPIFDFPLTYPKGFPQSDYADRTGWHPWSDDFNRMVINSPYNSTDRSLIYPQPIFSDIEFDIDGSMILVFADRAGLQSGVRNADLAGSMSPRWTSGYSGGDVLRATFTGSAYILENNAKAGASSGYGSNNNQGPGFGEFYNDDWFYGTALVHSEIVFGGLALRPGSGESIFSCMDPINYPNTGENFDLYGNSGGIRYVNNTSGLSNAGSNAGFILYNTFIPATNAGTFGKATGLGDLEVGCDLPTYLEIGNRVWNDVNKNGIQDPCEKALKDVNVTLYKGATKIATTKTDLNGEYYFSSKSKIGTGTWSGMGADTALLATTAYKVVFGEGQTNSGKLTVSGLGLFEITLKDATANNGNDQNDSDAEVVSGAFCINLTTGTAGSVNHTFDAGFYCSNLDFGNKITQTPATCNLLTPNNNGKVTLSAAVTSYDKFRTRLSTAAWGVDSSYATATALGTTFPIDLVTTAPNAGATYVIRFYTGECCYKDTMITTPIVNCFLPCNLSAAISGTNVTCNGGTDGSASVTASGNIAQVTYLWSNSATAQSISNLTAGTYTVTVTESPTCTTTSSYTVTEPSVLKVACAKTDVTTSGGNDGTASITVTGGTSPYTYLWSNGATTQSISNLTAGTYSVTVSDTNNCTSTCSTTVNEPGCALTATATGTNVTCNGGTNGIANVTATGNIAPVTYLWSNGATTQSISNLTAGTYTVTVTETLTCKTTASYTVTEPSVLNVACAKTDVTTSGGNDGTASVTVTGGTSPYTYLWSNGATTQSISNLTAGTYSVTVSDTNNCTSTCSTTVNEPGCALTATATGTNVTCNGGTNGIANVTASGNIAPVTYLWSNGATTQSISNLTAGTYTVTVTETATCKTTSSYTVTEPSVLNVACAKTDVTTSGGNDGTASITVTGGTSPYTYLWSNGATTQSISNLTAGTYTVTVSDVNGCSATCSSTINEPGCNLNATTTGTSVTCNGGNVGTASVTASGNIAPVTYLWSNGATTQSISNLTAGTYTVTVTETATCKTTSSYTVTEPSILNVACAKTDVTTSGGNDGTASVTATGGTSPYTYLWSNGATTQSISNLTAGTYAVTVSDTNNCTSTCSTTVNEPGCALTATATGTNVTCNGGTNGIANVTASGNIAPVTYLWSNGATTQSISNLTAGTYTVTVAETPTCKTTSSYTVTEPSVLNVACAKTDVTTSGGNDGTASVTVTGGTSPYTYLWSNGATTQSISNLTAGTYTVTVSDVNGCSATCSSTINEPGCNLNATTTGTSVTCNGGTNGIANVTASGNIAPVTYLWSNGATTQSISNLTAGTYTVTVTETATCKTTLSYTVTEPSILNVACAKTDVTTNGGNDGTASVTATGGTSPYTYAWSNGATTQSISNLTAGTYSVTVSDANNCSATCTTTVNEPNAIYGSIGDYVWMDNNKDGIQDNTEPAIQGVILELYNANNLTTPIAKDTTDSNGLYLFSNLTAGDYIVKAVKTSFPIGKVITGTNNGTDDIDSDFDVSTGLSSTITLNPNNTGGNPLLKDNPTIDLGLYLPFVCPPKTCSPVSVRKIK